MLAAKKSNLTNEPGMARHARFVHELCSRAFRLNYMKEFNQAHAKSILKSAHERRALDVNSTELTSVDLSDELIIEEMRREIHATIVNRCAALLVLTSGAAIAVTLLLYSLAWDNSRHVKAEYIKAFGYSSSSETLANGREPQEKATIKSALIAKAKAAKEKYLAQRQAKREEASAGEK